MNHLASNAKASQSDSRAWTHRTPTVTGRTSVAAGDRMKARESGIGRAYTGDNPRPAIAEYGHRSNT